MAFCGLLLIITFTASLRRRCPDDITCHYVMAYSPAEFSRRLKVHPTIACACLIVSTCLETFSFGSTVGAALCSGDIAYCYLVHLVINGVYGPVETDFSKWPLFGQELSIQLST